MIGEEDLDSSEVPEDWIELSQSQDVLSIADRLPERLKNVTDDQVSLVSMVTGVFDEACS